MKAKNVRAVCKAKLKHFLKHIEGEGADQIQKIIQENAIITGGAIASMLLGEEVTDFDIYFRTRSATFAVAEWFVNQFAKSPPKRSKSRGELNIKVVSLDDRVKVRIKSAGVVSETASDEYQYFESTDPESGDAAEYTEAVFKVIQDAEDVKEKPKYRPVFLSGNAITLSDKIQLVTRFFGEPDEIHANYDFVHCTNYWTSWDNEIVLRPAAIESLLAKELRYVGSKYPLCSMIRTRKFIQRGWSCTAGQFLKMAMQLNDLDLHDFSILEDQLVGVDMAYFAEVLAALREKDDKRVDAAYLVQLVDRIF